MPAKGFLTQAQKEQLQTAIREDASPLFRERCLMLLLMNDGKTYNQIAEFIGCSRRTVAYWCVHGAADNLESLRDRREQGNHRKATDTYIQLLLEVVEKEPTELGYEFGSWTGARLAAHLAKQTGIHLSSVQVRELLRRKKYAYLAGIVQSRRQARRRQACRLQAEISPTEARGRKLSPSGFRYGFGMKQGLVYA